MKSKWVNEKEKLEDLILVQNLSYEEIGRLYGCSGANIKKVANKIGIKLPVRRHFTNFVNPNPKKEYRCLNCDKILEKGSNHRHNFCDIKCQTEYQHKQRYQKILDGDPSIMRADYFPKSFKADILKEQDGVCAICKMKPEWNGKPLVFILDHIDGHASNNKRDNLRCICPNCDSQLDTYKSKNKNGERSYRRTQKMSNENS